MSLFKNVSLTPVADALLVARARSSMPVAITALDLRKEKDRAISEVTAELALKERPAIPAKRLEQRPVDAQSEMYLREYADLAEVIGIAPPDLVIESFKTLLCRQDFPIFSLAEVTTYMDAKAVKESKEKAGWEWKPLRDKDNLADVSFGRGAERRWNNNNGGHLISSPASDFYSGPHDVLIPMEARIQGGPSTYHNPASSKPYDRTIPLHAVRRVAAIEKEFKGKVAFFVSDYALAPQILYPDPFLMAVIPNPSLQNGTGRFIIDFWDEPGFGIEQMLK